MKSKTAGFIRLIISIVLLLVFHYFYYDILSLIGIKVNGDIKVITDLIKYLLLASITFGMYFTSIKSGRNRYEKSLFSSILYSVVCLVFLVVITILVHEGLKKIGKPIPYMFTDYFNIPLSMNYIYKFASEVILMPFILVMIFPLGFSQSFKSSFTASLLAGLSYGILYGFLNNLSLNAMLLNGITPAIIIAFLTGLYRNTKNIWTVYITYSCYILFGIYILGYLK